MNIRLTSLIMLLFAVIGLWACGEDDEPKEPEVLEVLPSDIEALKLIHNQLGVDSEDYPAYWNPEDQSTWKNAGIELDTIIDEETQTRNLAVSALTLYVTREKDTSCQSPWACQPERSQGVRMCRLVF